MPHLELADGGFRLDGTLPEGILDELRLRDLQRPRWSSALRAWTLDASERGIAAVRFLTETHAVAADAAALARIVELELAQHAPTHQERVAALEARLRPYQRDGVAFALARQRILLADAMGLGKSLQALVAVEKAGAFPCIVVCPAAVKLGWQREVVKWVPWRSAQVVATGREPLRGADVTVLNPELLPSQMEALRGLEAKALVLDEAHFFKNPESQRSRNALGLSRGVPLRLALTGTPIKNRREDLEHQLRILDQLEPVLHIYRGILPHWWKPGGEPLPQRFALAALHALDRKTLNARLREVCMIRRTKEEVAPDLPPLVRTRIEVSPPRTPAYEREEQATLDWVRKWRAAFGEQAAAMEAAAGPLSGLRTGSPGGGLEFRAHLTRLRREAALGKLAAVAEWAEDLMESGERVVFFAHHKAVVHELREVLPGRVATITGDTPPDERRSILDALDRFDFLVATMDSTGYGVDGIQLHASHVAFVELDWTPTKHEQCEGRLHRIGQMEHVNAWYFVASNTIDADLMAILDGKWADIVGVVDGVERDEQAFLGELLQRLGQRSVAAGAQAPA